ncbi:MAG: DUF5012 domain-containing protein [Dysgonamonadaceae bacterium]|nr:DUF5012 domain-containing protein [Dysgonamonadaceae bacterium]MDD4399898.1 DUF5012 domain-containing protein [Dysgonamonadaceae bacterium]
MKIYKYSLMLISILFLFACEKETEGISRVTFYTDLQLEGSAEMSVKQGQTFVEPGYIAIENDEDVTDKVQVNGTVNTNTPGAYQLSYVATNLDGFTKTVNRLVIVVPAEVSNVDVTGTYKGQRVGRAESADACVITSLSNGAFKATDFFGGFYNIVNGYGSAYRLLTYFYITPENEVVALSTNSPWGPWEVQNGLYNPATNVFTHATYQDGFSFNVILTKQ